MMEWSNDFNKLQPSTWYLVAIMYKNGMGTIGCATWDAERGWNVAEGDTVIAYISVKNIIKANNIEWPEHLTPGSV